MQLLIDSLNARPLGGMMLIVAVGYTLGRISWRGVSLGPAGGTILVGGLLGALGFNPGPTVFTTKGVISLGAFGFALFVYSVGFDAGPRFFSAFRTGHGWRYVLVGLMVNVIAVLVAILVAPWMGLGGDATAGVLAGGLSSAPTYAASVETVLEQHREIGAVTVAFAAAYPIGLVSLVLLAQFLPRMRRVDLADDAERLAPPPTRGGTYHETTRVFEVTSKASCHQPLHELDIPGRAGCWVTRIHRDNQALRPDADLVLRVGDHVLARGSLKALRALAELIGPEVEDRAVQDRTPRPNRVVVLSREASGKSLRDLELPGRTHTIATGVDRNGVRLEPTADLVLQRGDIVELVGRRSDTRRAAEVLGRLERPTHETNIAIYAGGIVLGLALGRIHLYPVGLDLTLGVAGGLLVSGLVLGRLQRIGPFTTHVPRAARQLVRDLGILLFVAEAGTVAGHELGLVHVSSILPILAASALVAILPVVLALWLACKVLRLRPVEAWGCVSGGMTSSAALTTLQRITGGSEVAIAYAAAYAPASVLATIAGRFIVLLLH